MADEKTEEKVKQTVPAMQRTAKGVADHAAAVQEMQWDKERRAFKDPFTVTMALFAYAKLLGSLLDEAELRLKLDQAAFAKRIAEFETRLTTLERWKVEAALQGEDMMKGIEEMMSGGKSPIDHLKALLGGGEKEEPVTTSAPLPDVVAVMDSKPAAMSALVSIKPGEAKRAEEKRPKEHKREEPKGGAA